MLSLTKLLLPNYVQILKRKREREKESNNGTYQ